MGNRRYQTIGVSSGIKKNQILSHKLCDDVKIRVCSDTSSELELTFSDGSKHKVLNLDMADYKVKTQKGLKLNYKGKDKNGEKKVSHQGYQNLGKWKEKDGKKKFVSLQDAWKEDIPFKEFFERVEV